MWCSILIFKWPYKHYLEYFQNVLIFIMVLKKIVWDYMVMYLVSLLQCSIWVIMWIMYHNLFVRLAIAFFFSFLFCSAPLSWCPLVLLILPLEHVLFGGWMQFALDWNIKVQGTTQIPQPDCPTNLAYFSGTILLSFSPTAISSSLNKHIAAGDCLACMTSFSIGLQHYFCISRSFLLLLFSSNKVPSTSFLLLV